jgi:PAP2 superfamily
MPPSQTRRDFLLTSAAPLILSACGGGGSGDSSGPAPSPPPPPASYIGPSAIHGWIDVAVDLLKTGGFQPPVAARMLAMLFTAVYDTLAPYDATAVANFAGGPVRITTNNTIAAQEKALAYAAYSTLLDIYAADSFQPPKLLAAMTALGFAPDANLPASDPGQLGREAAGRMQAFRWLDGSNQKGDLIAGAYFDYTDYKPVNSITQVNDPTRWQPLEFDNGRLPNFVTPHWGRVKPFALTSGSQFRPTVSLPAFNSAAYKAQADEVLAATAALTNEQKAIVEYWAGNPFSETPPGQWLLIAKEVSLRNRYSLAQDAKLFFALSNALMDAGIACWDCKVHYDSVRPITAVRTLYAGQQVTGLISKDSGTGLMPGQAWRPYQFATFITPPFAEYVSGHSTFSTAAAEVLARFTGSDAYGESATIAANSSTFQSGVPSQPVTLTWPTFTAAANQASISRLYGGIHFTAGLESGKTLGRAVGERVWTKANRLFSGIRE